jgi:hypothetical protein
VSLILGLSAEIGRRDILGFIEAKQEALGRHVLDTRNTLLEIEGHVNSLNSYNLLRLRAQNTRIVPLLLLTYAFNICMIMRPVVFRL